jgi:hypothetical protein
MARVHAPLSSILERMRDDERPVLHLALGALHHRLGLRLRHAVGCWAASQHAGSSQAVTTSSTARRDVDRSLISKLWRWLEGWWVVVMNGCVLLQFAWWCVLHRQVNAHALTVLAPRYGALRSPRAVGLGAAAMVPVSCSQHSHPVSSAAVSGHTQTPAC